MWWKSTSEVLNSGSLCCTTCLAYFPYKHSCTSHMWTTITQGTHKATSSYGIGWAQWVSRRARATPAAKFLQLPLGKRNCPWGAILLQFPPKLYSATGVQAFMLSVTWNAACKVTDIETWERHRLWRKYYHWLLLSNCASASLSM